MITRQLQIRFVLITISWQNHYWSAKMQIKWFIINNTHVIETKRELGRLNQQPKEEQTERVRRSVEKTGVKGHEALDIEAPIQGHP